MRASREAFSLAKLAWALAALWAWAASVRREQGPDSRAVCAGCHAAAVGLGGSCGSRGM